MEVIKTRSRVLTPEELSIIESVLRRELRCVSFEVRPLKPAACNEGEMRQVGKTRSDIDKGWSYNAPSHNRSTGAYTLKKLRRTVQELSTLNNVPELVRRPFRKLTTIKPAGDPIEPKVSSHIAISLDKIG
ncbi:unnamed protein product [Cylicocyclus nassatus]|uniref:Uncharacterized protein n=1 Tax=Cylicocyclus nassatus TaxID=53992 RepID=A0AA36GMB8_CYLNA|nr:unnamed protein product [Cylicocyclus nassatus]